MQQLDYSSSLCGCDTQVSNLGAGWVLMRW